MKRMKRQTTLCILFSSAIGLASAQQGEEIVDLEALLGGSSEVATSTEAEVEAVDAVFASEETGEAMEDAVVEAAAEVMEEPAAEAEATSSAPEKMEAAQRLAQQQRVRQEALRRDGLQALDDAGGAMANGQWSKAVELFDQALTKLPNVEALAPYIDYAKQQKAEAYYQMASGMYAKRNELESLSAARNFLNQAEAAYGASDKGNSLLSKIASYEKAKDEGKIQQNIKEEEKYQDRDANIRKLMARGRKEFKIRDFDEAENTFEKILAYDRYNRDALRFLSRISEVRRSVREEERRLSSKRMMEETQERWYLPLEIDMKGRQISGNGGETESYAPEDAELERRLNGIVIPQISFKRASIANVIEYLIQTSREVDPEGLGVNIIFMDPNLAGDTVEPDVAPVDDPFGFDDAAPSVGGGGSSTIPPITLELTNVTMLDALKWVTDIADLYYRFERNVVIIERQGAGPKITRFYPVDPTRFSSIRDSLPTGGGGAANDDPFAIPAAGGGGGSGDGDIRGLFEKYGVDFPNGTSISYDSTISQLIVTHSPDAFEKFERILKKINVQPTQIEIEARFVEVLQTDLEESGVEWILNDDAELLVRDGIAPVAARQRIQADANPTGATSGLRFFDFDGTSNAVQPGPRLGADTDFLGDILSIRGVLTNPELQMIVHAIDQKGNSDLLSAPRVTTINGVNAIIEVVREIIYPTEFDVQENDITISGGAAAAIFLPPTVIPGGFETREIGVILNVTPTVSTDNYTINLTILPEIAELVGWLQYGSSVPDPTTGSTFLVNMPQPIFASRNVTTSMIVWDGHTVVMGGLIREDVVSFEDKVPLLGDIPVIGRLFRSEGERSEKRNLLIFVTARLVDPAGKPIGASMNSDSISSAPQGVESGVDAL